MNSPWKPVHQLLHRSNWKPPVSLMCMFMACCLGLVVSCLVSLCHTLFLQTHALKMLACLFGIGLEWTSPRRKRLSSASLAHLFIVTFVSSSFILVSKWNCHPRGCGSYGLLTGLRHLSLNRRSRQELQKYKLGLSSQQSPPFYSFLLRS